MSSKKYRKQKIDAYVSVEDIARLKRICKESGFKSTYQLLQYLVHCFLRVADPANDPIDELVPDELREMFISPQEYRRLQKKLKQPSKKFEIQLLIPFCEYKAKKMQKVTITKQLSDEIVEIFTENTDWEKNHHSFGSHKEMIVRKKTDQRKIKSANDLN